MADHDTPLLLSSDSSTRSANDSSELSQLLLQALVVCFAWFFDAQQTFIAVFSDANPKWHCRAEGCDICRSPKESWVWDSPAGQHSSIVSEWDLYCAPSFFSGIPSSCFFMGSVIGGFALATLADSRLGRKNTLLLSCLIMSLSTFLTAFSTNIWVYSTLRFLSGFGRANVGTCAIVLSTELVGKQRWRGEVGVAGFFAFTFGFLSLPLLAYSFRGCSWRNLYICTSLPVFIYCFLLHFLVSESPRWAMLVQEGAVEAESIFSVMKMMFANKWSVKRMCGVMSIGFGAGMSYYGMPLGLGNLGTSLYLSTALNALSELPATLFTLLLIGRLNRRGTLVVFAMVSGICSVLSAVMVGLGEPWQSRVGIGLELVAFFSACTVVNVLLMFTIELFPTCVRNSAMSLVRQALVVGGVLGPFLSYGVLGMVIAACGLFAMCLPETNGRSIYDTMDEEGTISSHHLSPPHY